MQLLKRLFCPAVLGVLSNQAALAGKKKASARRGRTASRFACSHRLSHRRSGHWRRAAILFARPADGPFRLALIAHASTQTPLRRAQMPHERNRAAWRPLFGHAGGNLRGWCGTPGPWGPVGAIAEARGPM